MENQDLEFEWVSRETDHDTYGKILYHYLVDPSGQIRADIEEPVAGRLPYILDIYWAESRYSHWTQLSLAKHYAEQQYLDHMKSRMKVKRTRKIVKK